MKHFPHRALLALSALVYSACPGFGEIDRSTEVETLTPASELKRRVDGGTPNTVQLTSARGRPIEVNFVQPPRPMLVVFSRSDCSRCRQEATSVSAFALQYRNRLDVLGVQLDLTAAEARRYAELRGDFPMAWDPAGDVARALGVTEPATLVLLGTDGRVLLRQKWLSPMIRDTVEELVGDSGRQAPVEQEVAPMRL